MRSLSVRCPVCGRYVSVIGRDKIARHNNYDTRAPGTAFAYLVCKGSGADGSKAAANARLANERARTESDLGNAEHHLRRARADVDNASAWSTKCLDDVTRLRAKLATMQLDEDVENESPAMELVTTTEAQS